ncbi:MAG: hypothetical protein DRO01_00070 [Thermoproteota archaeon]|nr:MAG: hypothetical protein DRO01_00070 [Candidatus Korarchaeota archaeon]
MKVLVTDGEILERFKKEFGKEVFHKIDALNLIKKIYYEKTGSFCSTNTARDKLNNLILLGMVKPEGINLMRLVGNENKEK